MLSRVASSIYWLNRYVERAENYARFIDVNLNLTMDMPPGLSEQWAPLIKITGDNHTFEAAYGEYSKDAVIQFMTFDLNNPNSILSCLASARENARTIREIISSELWQQLNELYLAVIQTKQATTPNFSEFYRQIKMGAHLFAGVMDATLSHNEGWHFGQLGRLLERADKTTRTLDMKYFYLLPQVSDVGSPLDYLQWSALLKSASAYEAYRKVYGRLDYRWVVAFLIFDRDFPRAIQFCLMAADRSLHAISNTQLASFNNGAEKDMGKLISQLNFTDVDDVFHYGLHEYLDNLQTKLNEVGGSIHNSFFSINTVPN